MASGQYCHPKFEPVHPKQQKTQRLQTLAVFQNKQQYASDISFFSRLAVLRSYTMSLLISPYWISDQPATPEK